MARLIDADALKKQSEESAAIEWNQKVAPVSWAYAEEDFAQRIDDAPTIDAVPVVRCKDCRHCKPVVNENCEVVGCWCDEFEIVDVAENHFCSRGERKDGDE